MSEPEARIQVPEALSLEAPDLAREFRRFKTEWQIYSRETNIHLEEDERQAAILLAFLGTEAFCVYLEMPLTDSQRQSPIALLEVFARYCGDDVVVSEETTDLSSRRETLPQERADSRQREAPRERAESNRRRRGDNDLTQRQNRPAKNNSRHREMSTSYETLLREQAEDSRRDDYRSHEDSEGQRGMSILRNSCHERQTIDTFSMEDVFEEFEDSGELMRFMFNGNSATNVNRDETANDCANDLANSENEFENYFEDDVTIDFKDEFKTFMEIPIQRESRCTSDCEISDVAKDEIMELLKDETAFVNKDDEEDDDDEEEFEIFIALPIKTRMKETRRTCITETSFQPMDVRPTCNDPSTLQSISPAVELCNYSCLEEEILPGATFQFPPSPLQPSVDEEKAAKPSVDSHPTLDPIVSTAGVINSFRLRERLQRIPDANAVFRRMSGANTVAVPEADRDFTAEGPFANLPTPPSPPSAGRSTTCDQLRFYLQRETPMSFPSSAFSTAFSEKRLSRRGHPVRVRLKRRKRRRRRSRGQPRNKLCDTNDRAFPPTEPSFRTNATRWTLQIIPFREG